MGLESLDITQVPFNRLIGLRPSDRPDCFFTLPADPRYTNHLGTLHAGLLFSLAESASGECLRRALASVPGSAAILPVVRRVLAKYQRPARGAVHGRATADPAALQHALDQLSRRGRTKIDVSAEVIDDAGATVLTATFEWFLTRA